MGIDNTIYSNWNINSSGYGMGEITRPCIDLRCPLRRKKGLDNICSTTTKTPTIMSTGDSRGPKLSGGSLRKQRLRNNDIHGNIKSAIVLKQKPFPFQTGLQSTMDNPLLIRPMSNKNHRRFMEKANSRPISNNSRVNMSSLQYKHIL